MSSYLIYVLSVLRRDWQRLAVSCMVFLVTLLASATALAQNQGDSPYGTDDRPCIETVNPNIVMDGQAYAVITLNGHKAEVDPKACSLYAAAQLYPIYKPSTKTKLGPYAFGRAVYAANQKWLGHVVRGCVPTHDRRPPEDATDEEKAFCPIGRVNYVASPSNGWKAKIRIPTVPTLTWGEAQQTAAKVACAEATSQTARQACQEAGQTVGQQASSSSSAPSSSAPAAGNQSVPPVNDAGAVSDQADGRIKQLEAENADLRAKLAKAEQKVQDQIQPSANAGQNSLLPWGIVIFFVIFIVIWVIMDRQRKRQAKAANSRDDDTIPPHVATLRTQLQEAGAKVKELETKLSDSKQESQRQLSLKDAEIKQLREQHKAELETKKQEDLRIREELKHVRQNSVDKSVYTQSESDNAKLRKEIGEVANQKAQLKQRTEQAEAKATAQQDAEVLRLTSENSALQGEVDRLTDEVISLAGSPEPQAAEPAAAPEGDLAAENLTLKREINDYNARVLELQGEVAQKDRHIQSLQDRLGQALAGEPPTTMPFPPTTETSSPTTETSSHPVQTGRMADTDPFSLLTMAEKAIVRAIAEAYRQYMPDLIELLGGEPVMLEGVGPQIIFSRVIRSAERRKEKLLQAADEAARYKAQAETAERQVGAHMQTIAGLSEELQRAARVQRQAIPQGEQPKSEDQSHAAAGQGDDDAPDAPAASPSAMPVHTAYADKHLGTPPVPKDVEPDYETRLSWYGNENAPEAPTVPRGRTVTQAFEIAGVRPAAEPAAEAAEQPTQPGGRPSFAKTLAPSPRLPPIDPDEPDKGDGG